MTPPGATAVTLARLDDVTVRHGRVTVLDSVSLAVEEGRHLALVGRSGAGKTSVLRCVLGRTRPARGRVEVAGREVTGRPRHDRWLSGVLAHVAQDATGSLDPRRDVAAVIAEPLVCARVEPARRDLRVRQVLDLVALPSTVLARRPHELSGGQRQRVAVARALTPRPRLLTADEPLAGLDAATRLDLVRTLRDVLAVEQATLVLASHDLGAAALLCDTVVGLDAGRVVAPVDGAAG